ncbi:MAG: radical SAM protein [Methanoregula sp.]|jgi:uncharacterized protein|uniref:radical SAM protein n=1 Tax=Methanoregula sp. TaxID=2052170 RepID=UPI003D0E8602
MDGYQMKKGDNGGSIVNSIKMGANPNNTIFYEKKIVNNSILQRSQFTHLFERDQVFCFFHTLTQQMIFGDKIVNDLFTTFSKATPVQNVIENYSKKYSTESITQIILDLLKNGLIFEDTAKDVKLYKNLYLKALNQYQIQHMYLLPTNACNFRCKYCFIEDEDRYQTPIFMDMITAENAIISFAQLCQKSQKNNITFYGGEPLLNPKVTFFSLRLIRQLENEGKFANKVQVSLLTNGSLVDQEAISVFKETKPSISVSIDGPQILHDSARIDEWGDGTYHAAIRGYRRLQDAGLKPGISCTLNAFTIKHIDEIVDFIIDEIKPQGLGFNILLPQIKGLTPCSDLDYEFASLQLIKAFKRLREAGIYEDRVMRRVRPYISQYFHFKDCMGVGGQIVISPSGRFGPCQALLGIDDQKYFPHYINHFASEYQQLTSEIIYKDPLFFEWCHRFPLNMSECINCQAISVCGGGCPYASMVTDGSIWEIDKRVCFQAKNILEWMIWDTYEHMNSEVKNIYGYEL